MVGLSQESSEPKCRVCNWKGLESRGLSHLLIVLIQLHDLQDQGKPDRFKPVLEAPNQFKKDPLQGWR